MATTLHRISETVIIPKSCRERFLPVQHPSLTVLRECGVRQAGLSVLKPPYRIGRGDCPFHVAILTIAGRGRFTTGAAQGDFRPGELWIAGRGSTYEYWTDQTWSAVWFHLAALPRWGGLSTRGFHRGKSAAGRHLWDLAGGALNEFARGESGWERSVRAYADVMAVLLERELATAAGDAKLSNVQRKLDALWERIDNDLQHAWTIAEMAREFRLSPVQFHRLTLAHCGATPMQKVARLRMRRAEAMLRNPDYKLSTIAAAVGYETPFALSRAYKRIMGKSPRLF